MGAVGRVSYPLAPMHCLRLEGDHDGYVVVFVRLGVWRDVQLRPLAPRRMGGAAAHCPSDGCGGRNLVLVVCTLLPVWHGCWRGVAFVCSENAMLVGHELSGARALRTQFVCFGARG